MRYSLEDFIRESNRIEGINRDPTEDEIKAHARLMDLDKIEIDHLIGFVHVVAGARLRDQIGLDVRVGGHIPPRGGPEIRTRLDQILYDAMNSAPPMKHAYRIHHDYEKLHPFTDGNGRSGRALWLWMMGEAPLGFLHHWYYQSLSHGRSS